MHTQLTEVVMYNVPLVHLSYKFMYITNTLQIQSIYSECRKKETKYRSRVCTKKFAPTKYIEKNIYSFLFLLI